MKNSVIFPVISLLISVVLLTAGCEKESGLPVDGDGNVYDTVIIGTQVWLKENLKTTRYNNGVQIPLVTDNDKWASMTSAAYCWYNNNPEYKDNYGALYNGWVVSTGLLCPVGWHVPTKEEWETLINYLGSCAGDKLKDTKFWRSPFSNYSPPYYLNESGFSARPGGCRAENGGFGYIGEAGIWWTSFDLWEGFRGWSVNIYNWLCNVYIVSSYQGKKMACSVRCIKNN
ncbi:MAG: fibrobacter succinogenes major paralogous domain-containing protein [Bacteroidales bacterium]